MVFLLLSGVVAKSVLRTLQMRVQWNNEPISFFNLILLKEMSSSCGVGSYFHPWYLMQ